MRKSIWIVAALLFACANSQAQRMVAKRNMVTVEQEGFYEFRLDSSLLAFAESPPRNIKIRDADGHEVPWLHKEFEQQSEVVFEPVHAIDVTQVAGEKTTVLLTDLDQPDWESVCLQVTPAQVTKMGKIHGSRDGKNWYVVMDQFFLRPAFCENGKYESRLIRCQHLDYPYLKIELADSTSAPLEVVGVGRYVHQVAEEELRTTLPEPKIELMSSESESLYRLTWDRAYPMDRMELSYDGLAFFNREVRFYSIARQKKYKRKRRLKHRQNDKYTWQEREIPRGSFKLNSSSNSFVFDHFNKCDTLYIAIEKGSLAPVELLEVRPSMVTQGLQLWLEKGEHSIELWSEKTPHTHYDMEDFAVRAPEEFPAIAMQGKLHVFPPEAKPTDLEKRGVWIYLSLAVVVILIIIIVRQVIQNMPEADQVNAG